MKAITLTQPWATLVAIGAKKIETRSWRTNYRGPLAIHASKDFPASAKSLLLTEPFRSALMKENNISLDFPIGAIVAVCDLIAVRSILPQHTNRQLREWRYCIGGHDRIFELSDQEFDFGDYAPGRYAWLLHNVRPITPAIPMRGALGLWDCDKLEVEA